MVIPVIVAWSSDLVRPGASRPPTILAVSHPEVDPLARLLSDARLVAPDQLPAVVAEAAALLGVRTATIYVIDYAQQVLVPVGGGESEVLSVDATVGGRAFRHVEIITVDTGNGPIVWVPLLDGVERLGVVRFSATLGTALPVRRLSDIAGLTAELLVSKQQYGDGLRIVRRREPMQLPAELQWQLLPPLTFGSDRVVISGILEPSYEIGGDSFDYAVNGDTAHVAVFDAMGHGLEASVLSTVAIGAYRNARRTGLDLLDMHRAIDTAIGLQFGPDRFVTGVLADVDLLTGVMKLIAAGHEGPLLLRGGKVVKHLAPPPALPFGLGDRSLETAEEHLQPGDRLLLYTDGVVEARDERGEFFGVERLGDFLVRESASGHPVPEILRRLSRALLAHQHGRLQDDATTLLVEWRLPDPARDAEPPLR